MRVAIATETFLPSIDGVVTRLVHTVDWLAAHGHEVCVVAPDLGVREYAPVKRGAPTPDAAGKGGVPSDSTAARRGDEKRPTSSDAQACHVEATQGLDALRVPILGVPTFTYPFYRSRPWARPSHAAARHLAAFAPDLVHAAQPDALGATAVRWAARNGVPLVTSYHTDVEKYLRYYAPAPLAGIAAHALVRYERSLHDRAPVTLVTSEAMRERLARLGHTGLHLLPRGVDLTMRAPRFRSSQMRTRLTGGEPERPLLVYVGRVAAEKNLESLAPLLRAHPDWALAIVGDGPARPALEAALRGLRVTFTGFLGGEDLAAAFASGDAFVFPSTTETLGLVIAEAQASGVPVLAASSPATREQVRDGVDGLVYDATVQGRTTGGLIERAERLMGDGALRARLAAGGVEATRSCGWDASGAATFAAYEEAVERYAKGWRP